MLKELLGLLLLSGLLGAAAEYAGFLPPLGYVLSGILLAKSLPQDIITLTLSLYLFVLGLELPRRRMASALRLLPVLPLLLGTGVAMGLALSTFIFQEMKSRLLLALFFALPAPLLLLREADRYPGTSVHGSVAAGLAVASALITAYVLALLHSPLSVLLLLLLLPVLQRVRLPLRSGEARLFFLAVLLYAALLSEPHVGPVAFFLAGIAGSSVYAEMQGGLRRTIRGLALLLFYSALGFVGVDLTALSLLQALLLVLGKLLLAFLYYFFLFRLTGIGEARGIASVLPLLHPVLLFLLPSPVLLLSLLFTLLLTPLSWTLPAPASYLRADVPSTRLPLYLYALGFVPLPFLLTGNFYALLLGALALTALIAFAVPEFSRLAESVFLSKRDYGVSLLFTFFLLYSVLLGMVPLVVLALLLYVYGMLRLWSPQQKLY